MMHVATNTTFEIKYQRCVTKEHLIIRQALVARVFVESVKVYEQIGVWKDLVATAYHE